MYIFLENESNLFYKTRIKKFINTKLVSIEMLRVINIQ
jgi:hypothetical protein